MHPAANPSLNITITSQSIRQFHKQLEYFVINGATSSRFVMLLLFVVLFSMLVVVVVVAVVVVALVGIVRLIVMVENEMK